MKKIYLLSIIILISCNGEKRVQDSADSPSKQGYDLVWQDEFNGNRLDDSKWGFEEGFIRNREKQYYNKNAVAVRDGNLVITAKKDSIENESYSLRDSAQWKHDARYAEYSSGSITTKDRVAWKYGRIEVRAKLPEGKGLWPALWMLGENWEEVGWPETGEIDIMEHVGFEPDSIFGTVHTKAFNHMLGTHRGKKIFIDDPYGTFHVYAIEWNRDKIDFLLDGKVYNSFGNKHRTTAEWPFDQKFHLKINVAVGGMLGGRKGIDDGILPQKMYVDYVRVYK